MKRYLLVVVLLLSISQIANAQRLLEIKGFTIDGPSFPPGIYIVEISLNFRHVPTDANGDPISAAIPSVFESGGTGTYSLAVSSTNGVLWNILGKMQSPFICLDLGYLAEHQKFDIEISQLRILRGNIEIANITDFSKSVIRADGDDLLNMSNFFLSNLTPSGIYKLTFPNISYWAPGTAVNVLPPFLDRSAKYMYSELDEHFRMRISRSNYNMHNPSGDINGYYHNFFTKFNGENIAGLTPVVENVSSDNVIYEWPATYIDPDNDDFETSNSYHDIHKVYTDYNIKMCQFVECQASSGDFEGCSAAFPGVGDNLQRSSQTINVRIYRQLEWVKTTYQNPCLTGGTPGYLDVFLGRRIGGYGEDQPFIMQLYKDNQPNGIFEEGCETLVRELRQKDPFNGGPPSVRFSGLSSGDYRLVVTSNPAVMDCGAYEYDFTLVDLATVKLEITPNPVFVCPGNTEVATATAGFQNYLWTRICDNTTSTGSTLTVGRNQGGLYRLTATDNQACLQQADLVVVDLNIPELTLPQIDQVLGVSATKYEHTSTPVTAALSWNSIEDINSFYGKNSYMSGKAGIYKAKQTFDYLDGRVSQRLSGGTLPPGAEHNMDIQNSGFFDDLHIFQWQHPGFLKCAPKWKLNTTTTKFGPDGQALEVKDIMGLYSSSLYAYSNTVPVAVAPLGRLHEIAFESFEEYMDDEAQVNQLNNSTGNFDFVKTIVSGQVPFYEEYEIKAGMANYGIVAVPLPEDCSDIPFEGEVINRSVPSGLGCDAGKITEGENYVTGNIMLENPCVSPTGTLIKFGKGIPTFLSEKEFYCTFWTGVLRLKRQHYYTAKTYSSISYTDEKAHTGRRSMKIIPSNEPVVFEHKEVRLEPDKEYVLSMWVHTEDNHELTPKELDIENKVNKVEVRLQVGNKNMRGVSHRPSGPVINGWQKLEVTFKTDYKGGTLYTEFDPQVDMYIDDIRVSPLNSGMQTYVYHTGNYRLLASLDQNNYAVYYKYDDEGNLFSVSKETVEGIKTIQVNQSYIPKSQ